MDFIALAAAAEAAEPMTDESVIRVLIAFIAGNVTGAIGMAILISVIAYIRRLAKG